VKRMLLAGLFVFSLAANLAVGVTLAWHYWRDARPTTADTTPEPSLDKKELKRLYAMWPRSDRKKMMEFRRKIMEKRAEILDQIAANPGDPNAVDKSLKELVALREQMERKAMTDISAIMANLPEPERKAFISLLKQRHAHKMDRGWGRKDKRQREGAGNGEMPCQPRLKSGEKPQQSDPEKSSRDFPAAPVNH
jgi:uncharacterized membrane protein